MNIFIIRMLALTGILVITGTPMGGMALELTFTELVSDVPQVVHITHAGDGSNRLFLVRQEGTIELVKDNVLAPTPFLDISDRVRSGGERGLLSVAFPPGFKVKRHFYVYYTDLNGDSVISRFRVTADADRADAGSEETILQFAQPFGNHNGGQLAFGPDGYLYIASGDGGSGGDPMGNGQRLSTLLGKLLRIDVESGTEPYDIPADNPFLDRQNARPEIWAYGLRNPWRFSFDQQTGDLYIADVGQRTREEVNFEPAGYPGGRNYGWNIMEGTACFNATVCDSSGLTLPVAEYEHDLGCSITGGHVYRGRLYSAMAGIYFFGDFCSGRIWSLERQGDGWLTTERVSTDFTISTFGEDEAGNLYVADYSDGRVYLMTDGEPKAAKPLITAGFSGLWYNPDQDGHGFLLEVLPDRRLVAYWFTYDLGGNQAWVVGVGPILGDSVTVEALITEGGRFGSSFDPTTVRQIPWGTLAITFESCHFGTVSYAATDDVFGSGSIPVTRLTALDGLACGD